MWRAAAAIQLLTRSRLLREANSARCYRTADLDEQVQRANQAALGLSDAFVYLVNSQLRVGLEAQLQPLVGRTMREE